MKYSLLALVFFSTLSAFADGEVKNAIGKFGSWSAAEIKTHIHRQKDGCLASTASGTSTLEVFAQLISDAPAKYTDPTVQVVTPKIRVYYSGILTLDAASKKFKMIRTINKNGMYAVMSRVEDRAAIVQALKDSENASISLVDAQGDEIASMDFSLRGSTAAIDAAFNRCNLSL